MDKKTYTVLITTNRHGQTRALSMSASWVKTLGVLGVIFSVLVGAALVDYLSLLLDAAESKRLRIENSQLLKQFKVVESKLHSLEGSLERVKNFSTKLKLITNIDDTDRSLKLAMGVNPKPGQAIEEGFAGGKGERRPASEFLTKDDLFLQHPPLDENQGELWQQTDRGYATLSVRIDKAVRETELREQSILELWEFLSERQSLINATPNIRPVRGWMSSKFGYRVDPFTGRPVMHLGIDLAGAPGTPVWAPADGVVSYVGYEAGYGKLVSIDHGYGVVTRFGHNSQILVKVGQKVKRRDVVASLGNTGRSSGPHVHYEVRVNGVPIDPAYYILDE